MSTDVSIHKVRNVVVAHDSMGDTRWSTITVYSEHGDTECELTLFHADDIEHIDGLQKGERYDDDDMHG